MMIQELIKMADSNVLKAQKYLNAMFGGSPSWVKLKEDGNTGTATMEGIIRAFQIQNGVSSVTGTVGPLTISKMKGLDRISKMEPDDEPIVNVCLVQCALFCKGYAAGGITGIYYNSGVAAVKNMQMDAGLEVTGIIDWKVWAGLLSLNWFTKVLGGDNNVRIIQQQLNGDWSDIIGVGPCDGIVSRQTVLSLVGALQAVEGVTTELITDINSVNFGEATTAAFPSTLKMNQNTGKYISYNKLVQYGLYFNGYNPRRFDGTFDATTKSCVSEFQEFYGLTGIGLVVVGEVNVSTMKSLLTSKGDTNRSAKACDCSTILNKQQALDLKSAGYTHVGRYLTGSVGIEHTPKLLTSEEVKYIEAAGLSVFPIYQDGGYELDYFKDPTQGSVDAQTAILAAKRIGIPEGVTIYFAVDFDCYGYQIDSFIIPYFQQIYMMFYSTRNDKNYRIGIYAPRYVCTKVCEAGLASSSFVGDMSTGFSCNLGYPIPKNWAFDQFVEKDFLSSSTFPIDKDGYSGRDKGFNIFDDVPEHTQEEIDMENQLAKLEIARNQYIYNVVSPLGYLSKVMELGIEYNKEVLLEVITSPEGTVELTAEYSTSIKKPSETSYNIAIAVDNSGNLTMVCQNQISEITTELGDSGVEGIENFGNILTNIAMSVKLGSISFEIRNIVGTSAEFAIIANSQDLLPEDEKLDAEISVALVFKVSLNGDSGKEFSTEAFAEVALPVLAAAAAVVIVSVLLPEGVLASIITALSSAVGALGGLIVQVV